MGSDQLLHGTEGSDGLKGLDVVTSEVPVTSPPRTSVLADDGPRVGDAAISINLETNELPFQRPNPYTVPVEPARGWSVAFADGGKWPLAALGVAVVLVVVFAVFISRNGQSLGGDDEATDRPSAVESASAAATSDRLAGSPAQAEIGSDPLPPGDASDDDTSARSTGTLGPGEGSGFFTAQIVEPDRALTGTDLDWTPTTVAPPTTVTPPTSATTPSSAITPTTAASSTTAPDSTTTTPSTSTTATTAAPSGPSVRAIAPGTADEQNATTVAGRVTLEADGSNENMRYRFFVFVKTDDGDWRRVERSRWRSRPTWTIDVDRYEGRTLRWTVVGVSGFRNLTDESAPLYLRVGGGDGDGGDPPPDGDASLTDG